jgi:hypothetical protein
MNDRFYPSTILQFRNEPSRKKFRIIMQGEKGEGVIALAPFKKNRIVFAFSGEVLPYQTLFTLQMEPGKYLHDPFVMGKVLHSCEPNMRCDMRAFTFTALRDIQPNEYLTMDYETTEEELFRQFHCCCGSPNCRGLIRGYGARNLERYPIFTPDSVDIAAAPA